MFWLIRIIFNFPLFLLKKNRATCTRQFCTNAHQGSTYELLADYHVVTSKPTFINRQLCSMQVIIITNQRSVSDFKNQWDICLAATVIGYQPVVLLCWQKDFMSFGYYLLLVQRDLSFHQITSSIHIARCMQDSCTISPSHFKVSFSYWIHSVSFAPSSVRINPLPGLAVSKVSLGVL